MGKQIKNRYEMGVLIGEGAMGEVYRGIDTKTGEIVAIKILKSRIASTEQIERFAREGEALRQLNHPNIVKVLDAFEEDKRHFLILEYVSGGTLRDILNEQKQLATETVLRVGLELADALTRAHHLNIVHRDIKPANILIAEDGTPRLTDFGIARVGVNSRLTGTGAMVGTMDYLSPEATRGEALDYRTDIWAFGVTLYELLTGEVPFKGENFGALIYSILSDAYPPISHKRPDVPQDLMTLIDSMLIKDIESRLNSTRIIGADLEAIMRGEHTTTSAIYQKGSTSSGSGIIPRKLSTTSIDIDAPLHNLPTPSTPFVGRTDELQAINEQLSNPEIRLLTVLGVGGMGKTRLGIEIGKHQFDTIYHQHDGVFFVPLAPLTEAKNVVTSIAEAIGYSFFGAEPQQKQLTNYLNEKTMLLVMDNFEHVLDAADLVNNILETSPNIKILATSRSRLNLSAETLYPIQGLKFPEYATPEEFAELSSVKLFLQSAKRARPDFTITDDNRDAIAKICLLVQGMPLGIELAAAWVEMLSPNEIVEEIEGSLDFLETDMRDVPERHRSIRAVFDYSWQLMNDPEREVFIRLSALRGGFTRESAKIIAGANLRNLTTLANKSLISPKLDGRYEVHELLRQYGDAMLDEDEALHEKTHHALATYFTKWLADQYKLGQTDVVGFIKVIDSEIKNIRLALAHVSEERETDNLVQAINTLQNYYEMRSLYRESTEQFKLLADAFRDVGTPQAQEVYNWALVSQATQLNRLSPPDAQPLSWEAVQLAQQRGDAFLEGWASIWYSYVEMYLGNYDIALEYGERGTELIEKNNPTWSLMTGSGHLGYVYYLTGEYDKAEYCMKAAIEKIDQDGNQFQIAYNYNNYGELLRDTGRYQDAKDHFEKAYRIFKEINYERGMAFSSNNLGGLLQRINEFDEAEKYYRRSYQLSKRVGDKTGIGHALSALGSVRFFRAKIDDAKIYFQQSLEVRKSNGDQRGVADSLNDLGSIAVAQKDFETAEHLLQNSLSIRFEIGDQMGASRALLYLGELEVKRRDFVKARNYYERSIEVADKGKDNLFITGWSMVALGNLDIEEGNIDVGLARIEALGDAVAATPMRWAQNWGSAIMLYGHIMNNDLEQAEAIANEVIPSLIRDQHIMSTAYAIITLGYLAKAQGKREDAVKLAISALHAEGRNAYAMTTIKSQDLYDELVAIVPKSLVENTPIIDPITLIEELYSAATT